MKPEIHLFILWENARYKQEEILNDIKQNFDILNVYNMEWSKAKFSENLSRFYGTNLPVNSEKEKHCGNGKFLLVIVKDNNPKYEKRLTSKGLQIVNVNMFDKKESYRQKTGGGHKIHGTNSEKETNHDLTLLLDKNIEDYEKIIEKQMWNEEILEMQKDLFGSKGWESIKDMFYALNNCTEYAILRNYEQLPEEIYVNEHNDVDIICKSLEDVAYILNAQPVFEEEYRVHYKTKAENKDVYFDLRYINDNYYYNKLEERILANRVYNEKGFYTLNQEDYFYTLLYHTLIQKLDFREDYKERLIKLDTQNRVTNSTTLEEFANILEKWMRQNNYILVEPTDKSVIFNIHTARFLEPLVYREEITNQKINIENLQKENQDLRREINELKSEITGIRASRTWKIMEPFRSIKKNVKRG